MSTQWSYSAFNRTFGMQKRDFGIFEKKIGAILRCDTSRCTYIGFANGIAPQSADPFYVCLVSCHLPFLELSCSPQACANDLPQPVSNNAIDCAERMSKLKDKSSSAASSPAAATTPDAEKQIQGIPPAIAQVG